MEFCFKKLQGARKDLNQLLKLQNREDGSASDKRNCNHFCCCNQRGKENNSSESDSAASKKQDSRDSSDFDSGSDDLDVEAEPKAAN